MKHPKIVFSVSRIFHDTFIPEERLDNKKHKRLKEDARRFEIFFRQYEKQIYEKFRKYLDGKPNEDEIKVWITVEGKFPSISSPLILKSRSNHHLMLYILVHELVHRYFEFGRPYKDLHDNIWLQPGAKSEALMHIITRRVFSDISAAAVDNVFREVDRKIIDKKAGKVMEKISLDLDKMTVLEYIKTA